MWLSHFHPRKGSKSLHILSSGENKSGTMLSMTKYTLLLLLCLTAATASASPLFSDDAPVSMRLEADFTLMFKEKDKSKQYPAKLVYREGDESRQLEVQLGVRGNFRLKHCQVPGLRVHFSKEKEGLFRKQNKLKLVAQCRSKSTMYQDYVLQEYAVYRAFETLSELSFKTRLAEVEYIDTGKKGDSWQNFAFFIEDKGKMAKRLGMGTVEDNRVSHNDLAPKETALANIFMFLIGNTDYSLLKGEGDEPCCHNAKLLSSEAGFVPVPYDFDITGMVNTTYAAPPIELGIKKVTTRLYRGFCNSNEYIPETLALVKSKEAELRAVFSDERIRPKTVKRMLSFLDKYYDIADNPKRVDSKIIGKCRG
jgi:hypothetical protein